MLCYFSCKNKSAIKINGNFLGYISDDLQYYEIEMNSFIEICPIVSNCPSFCFVFDGQFLTCPPNDIYLTDLKGAYLIEYFCVENAPFSIISQQKFSNCIITVFADNGYKISIENENDFYVENLPFSIFNASIEQLKIDNSLFLINISSFDSFLFVYSINNKIKKVLSFNADSYENNEKFITTKFYKDILKHKIIIEWEYKDKQFIEKNRQIFNCDKNISNFPQKIIPYLFLEEYLINANYSHFLSNNIIDKISFLRDYLGEFIGIMPPPNFRRSNEIGLIKKKKNNLFFVDYVSFSLLNNKIDNIIISE